MLIVLNCNILQGDSQEYFPLVKLLLEPIAAHVNALIITKLTSRTRRQSRLLSCLSYCREGTLNLFVHLIKLQMLFVRV